jgi:hypothetical protein
LDAGFTPNLVRIARRFTVKQNVRDAVMTMAHIYVVMSMQSCLSWLSAQDAIV